VNECQVGHPILLAALMPEVLAQLKWGQEQYEGL